MYEYKGSAIVTRYKEPNYILIEALDSLLSQENVELEVLMLDQFYNKDIENYCSTHYTDNITFKYILIEPKSLSYAKNYGINHSSHNIVLFLDTDGIAAKNWSYEIIKSLITNDDIAVAGTKVIPKRNGKMFFLLKSKIFVNDYSMLDLGTENQLVPKVLGGSSGLDKHKLGKMAHFNENLGRRNGILLGGEETDMMNKITETGRKVLYLGNTYMIHQVEAKRMTYSWLFRRIFYSGVTKVLRGGKPSPNNFRRTAYDYLFLPLYLFFYISGYIYGLFRYKLLK